PVLRRDRRTENAGPPGSLSHRNGHREADAHRSRAKTDRTWHARRTIPVLFRDARADARDYGNSGAIDSGKRRSAALAGTRRVGKAGAISRPRYCEPPL